MCASFTFIPIDAGSGASSISPFGVGERDDPLIA